MEIFLIDGIGPFFRKYARRDINWSKIPYHFFFGKQKKSRKVFKAVERDLDTFCSRIKQIGYNCISLDDVAHLTPDPWIEPDLNTKISHMQACFRPLLDTITGHGLGIYFTMDVLSLTPGLKKQIGGSRSRACTFLKRQVDTFLATFPEVDGLILRIGECDGKDVKGDFISELLLYTPEQVNRMLKDLLPVFEIHCCNLVLRNWTVGAHPVGDFIWHRGTTAKVLKGIDSPRFILSMKYGESDFFRYLPLNRNFFRVQVKTMIELQARREYEGSGEYPSFVGYDYYDYFQELRSAENLVGMSVWCQTGGWVPFRRLSFLEEEGIWSEINSSVTIKIFREGMGVAEAVAMVAGEIGCDDPQSLLELLRLSDEVVKELLYTPALARKKLFFRRVRIPSQLSVFWNNIFIFHSVRKLMRVLVADGEQCVAEGYVALGKIQRMRELARSLDLREDDLRFMQDTFGILALAREYYFLPYSGEMKLRIQKAKKQYKTSYPKGTRARYRIKTDFSNFKIRRFHLRWSLRLLLRNKRGYRILDYLLTIHLLAYIVRSALYLHPRLIPKFARKSAMGIETIFR